MFLISKNSVKRSWDFLYKYSTIKEKMKNDYFKALTNVRNKFEEFRLNFSN